MVRVVFSSTLFLFAFLPLTISLTFLAPSRYRNFVLLIVSLVFYGWGEPLFIVLMLFSICLNYVSGLVLANGLRRIMRAPEMLSHHGVRTVQQKAVFAMFVSGNLLLLGVFKYFNFGVETYNNIVSGLGLSGSWLAAAVSIPLPLGISFYTFQAMSYPIDVYRGEVRATRNIVNFAAYVTLFPQLVAGPIVRYSTVADELVYRTVRLDEFASGVRRFIVGLSKKILIANQISAIADAAFAVAPGQHTASTVAIGVLCYSLQIYFDFSGYSDMAIGLGRMFGFHFLENFRHPYMSQSVQEFWRRWHISLSTWFRDYVYIPLGGNRHGRARTGFNLCLVFFLCGLWHGASWNFVVWGLYHGLFLSAERLGFDRVLSMCPRPVRHAYALLVVAVGWVFFRAEDLHGAFSMLGTVFGTSPMHWGAIDASVKVLPHQVLAIVVGVVAAAPIVQTMWGKARYRKTPGVSNAAPGSVWSTLLGDAVLALLLALCSIELSAGTYNPFIYFRF